VAGTAFFRSDLLDQDRDTIRGVSIGSVKSEGRRIGTHAIDCVVNIEKRRPRW